VPIPPFDVRDLLPPFIGINATTQERSPYLVTMSEFAGAMGTTAERRQLLRNLIAYRAMLAQAGYVSGVQFVDGSFVENVEVAENRPPRDIDIFSIVNMQPSYRGDLQIWGPSEFPFWRNEVANHALNKQRFALDTYALLFEELQPMGLIQGVIYWYGLFSHQRGTLAWKGFVALVLDPAGDQAALAALGSA
jgi:hypothetical protein